MSRIVSLRILLAAIAALGAAMLAGLYPAEASARPVAEETSEKESADALWARVLVPSVEVERRKDEDYGAYFMRWAEAMNRQRRVLGLKFWKAYPDDPRRFNWLIQTVHMPPKYPENIHEWADKEISLDPNDAALDKKALKDWERVYAGLREEFQASSEITDEQRRYFRFGELRQQLLDMPDAKARGEKINPGQRVADIIALGAAYPQPQGERDKAGHAVTFQALVGLVMDQNRKVYNWSPEEVADFSDRLIATQNLTYEYLGGKIRKTLNETGEHQFYVSLRLSLKPLSESRRGLWEGAGLWQAITAGLSARYSNTSDGKLVHAYDSLLWSTRYRYLGVLIWDDNPNPKQQLMFLGRSLGMGYIYAENLAEAIYQRSIGETEARIRDAEAEAEWNTFSNKLKGQVWNDPSITDDMRAANKNVELVAMRGACKAAWLQRRDKTCLTRLLNGVHELYTDYNDATGASKTALSVFNNRTLFGITDEELSAFIEPMRAYSDGTMLGVVLAYDNHMKLRETPFELSAPTMEGEPFDVADLRGKIVLVDHWATTCSSCIAAMPGIHDTYLRYKDLGFEVLSVCYDGKEKHKQVMRLEKEMGLTWTTLAADDAYNEVMTTYGYRSFPQYMLLNRDGTIYAGTGEVDYGRNLPALLDAMLAAEAAERGETYVPPR